MSGWATRIMHGKEKSNLTIFLIINIPSNKLVYITDFHAFLLNLPKYLDRNHLIEKISYPPKKNIRIMINELFTYETPLVEIIEVEVEKGFANSNPNGVIDPWEKIDE